MRGTLLAFVRLVGSFVVVAALAAAVAVPARGAEGDTVEFDLEELNDSGVSGTAVITDEGDSVLVEIEVSGPGVTGGQPAHIHEGTCADYDPFPLYPLADIDADGLSATTIDGVTLADLLAQPYVINVHENADELATAVACGDIVAPDAAAEETPTEATAVATGVGGETQYTPPGSGVGSAAGSGRSSLLLATMIGLAAIFATAGVALRRREQRG